MPETGFGILKYLYLLILSFLLLQNSVKAQSDFDYVKFIESVSSVPEDSLAKYLYNKSGEFERNDSLVAAGELINHSIEYAKLFSDTVLTGFCYIRQGGILRRLFEFNKSFTAFVNAYNISLQLPDTNMMLDAMAGIEVHYGQIDLIDSAMVYCYKAIEINKIKENFERLSDNYRGLGSYQTRYNEGGRSNSFLFDGIADSSLNAAYKSKNSYFLIYALTNYGFAMYDNDPEKGLKYLRAALDSARNFNRPTNALIYALTKTADKYLSTGFNEQARELVSEVLPIAIQLNNTQQQTHIYFLLGKMQFQDDSISKAIVSFTKAIKLAEKYRYNYFLPYIYRRLFDLYFSQNLFDSSFVYQGKYMNVFIEEHNQDMNREIARLSAKYQVEQKVEAIDNLTIINNQRKEIIGNQRRFIYSLIAGIIIVLILFVFLRLQYRKIKKAHLKLSLNALEINRKNKEIAELKKKRDQQLAVVHDVLKTKLIDLFENKEIYLKKGLTLSKTASKLKTNTSYVSSLINRYYHCKFNQFVNKYRIAKACELLSNRDKAHYSIEGIADLAGFKSKTVFNRAFKEATGVNPSTFRNATT